MDNLVKGYSERTIRALTDCAAGRRDIVIADDSKSQCSIYELERAGREMGLEFISCVLTSDNGKKASHRIFGRDLHHACHALDLINQRRGGYISRVHLQTELGRLLGYDDSDIVVFAESEIGQTCPCDCCGGES